MLEFIVVNIENFLFELKKNQIIIALSSSTVPFFLNNCLLFSCQDK